MSRLRFLLVAVVAVPVLGQARGLAAAGIPASTPEPIAINDNRTAAGTLDGTRLTVRLETREGEWHPDGDNDPGVRVLAFALEGGPLQIPGPLIRVTEGTEVRALVRNRLEKEPLISPWSAPRKSRWETGRPTTSSSRPPLPAICAWMSPMRSAIC
ncbi:MAG TPA: hypothetical protein VFT24_08520 [Vicinamibacterales bacterium]|nr:hypothetical protein [Vicinamibacterales bacterium]